MKTTSLILITLYFIFGSLFPYIDCSTALSIENKNSSLIRRADASYESRSDELTSLDIMHLIEASNDDNGKKIKPNRKKKKYTSTSTTTTKSTPTTRSSTKYTPPYVTPYTTYTTTRYTTTTYNYLPIDIKKHYDPYVKPPTEETIYEIEKTYQEYTFNRSLIVVWRKIENLNFRTSIFSSRLSNGENLIVWYYDTINSLVFEIIRPSSSSVFKILRLETLNFELLFFSFDLTGRLGINLDCPSLKSQIKEFELYVFDLIEDIKVSSEVQIYTRLEIATKSSGCKVVTTVYPSVVLYFNINLTLLNSALLFSFTNQAVSYSVIYFNGIIKLISSSGLSIPIDETSEQIMAANGIYFVFRHDCVQVYTSCPANREPVLEWATNFFVQKTQIETSLNFQTGSALIPMLLDKFCFTKFLAESVQNEKTNQISTRLVELYLENINAVSSFMELFLPAGQKVQKLLEFKSITGFSLNFLSRPEERILIASRVFAKRGFFDRSIKEYISGFSDGGHNFWIGLEVLSRVTQLYNYRLRIEVYNDTKIISEEYGIFKVGSDETRFRLTIANLKSGVNNFFEGHDYAEFSTVDFGNRRFQALKYSGGFWHRPSQPNSTIDNFYCFSCEDSFDSLGTSYTQTVSYISVKSYITRMYLVL